MIWRSWGRIPAPNTGWTFLKIVMFLWRDEDKRKRGSGWPIYWSTNWPPLLTGGSMGRLKQLMANNSQHFLFSTEKLLLSLWIELWLKCLCNSCLDLRAPKSAIKNFYQPITPSAYCSKDKKCQKEAKNGTFGQLDIIFFKWAIPGLVFPYFHLFNTVDSK